MKKTKKQQCPKITSATTEAHPIVWTGNIDGVLRNIYIKMRCDPRDKGNRIIVHCLGENVEIGFDDFTTRTQLESYRQKVAKSLVGKEASARYLIELLENNKL